MNGIFDVPSEGPSFGSWLLAKYIVANVGNFTV